MSISMMTLPLAQETSNIAGVGRKAPNQNPYLEPPKDRTPVHALAGGIVGGVKRLGKVAQDHLSNEPDGWAANGGGEASTHIVASANGPPPTNAHPEVGADGVEATLGNGAGGTKASKLLKRASNKNASAAAAVDGMPPPPPGGVSASADAGAGVGFAR